MNFWDIQKLYYVKHPNNAITQFVMCIQMYGLHAKKIKVERTKWLWELAMYEVLVEGFKITNLFGYARKYVIM